MSTYPHGQFLTAAYEILTQAGTSMHYSQITAAALQLGILKSNSKTAAIAMSSLLSQDIRKNPKSNFLRKRPGVYALSEIPEVASRRPTSETSSRATFLERLKYRTSLANTSLVLNKALYLANRTIDIAGPMKSLTYRSLSGSSSIDIQLPDLVKECITEKYCGNVGIGDDTNLHRISRLNQVATRLALKDYRVAVQVALFLLDLALDLSGQDDVIGIESCYSSN